MRSYNWSVVIVFVWNEIPDVKKSLRMKYVNSIFELIFHAI